MGFPDRILIINTFGIGDVLFTTPIVTNLKKAFPESQIGFLCNKRTEPIISNNPNIDWTFIYERDEFENIKRQSKLLWIKKYLEFMGGIKKKHFDVVFDLSLNSQFGFLGWYAGIKRRIGFDYKGRGRFLTDKIKIKGYEDKHVVEYYLSLLKFVKITFPYNNKLAIFDSNKNTLLKRNMKAVSDRTIVIIPCGGASWGKQAFFKHWDKDNYTVLINRLIKEYRLRIILAGDKKEEETVKYIARNIHCNSEEASGLPLMDFLNLLEQADLVITNDGGPLHMAVALGLKIVSIFGPVDEKVYGPYPFDPEQHIVVKKDLPCRPCYKKFRLPQCPYDRKCLKDITVEEVFQAAKSLLVNPV